ncbi:MAG: four helix bundle protein [Bacteroidota bacterium]
MKIERFEDIESWKKSRELTSRIYGLTAKGGLAKDFGLRDQIQRASVSIMANIAEGFDSGSKKSFILFLNYAYRSTSEVQSLLYVVVDCRYVTQKEFDELFIATKDIKNLIGGFIQYLLKSNKHT